MKILYAIQGTGNGHLARATEIVPILREMANTDILVSGCQADIALPFPVSYQRYGISFIFGTNGGINFLKTVSGLRPFLFFKDVFYLPVNKYDLIISDFEPVSAWACKLRGKKCIGLSHQNAVLHKNAPRPKKTDWAGKLILKYYAPVSKKYGFHFRALDKFNFTPVIRSAIRNAKPKNNKHYTVYLPAFNNSEIENVLSAFPEVQWEVFSKHNKETYQRNNIHFQPVSLENFNRSFINCEGILCNAGFETPAEAIYMGKKLCVVPMKYQYEQACNARFLSEMGVLVISDLVNHKKELGFWLRMENAIQIKYPDETRRILGAILDTEKTKPEKDSLNKIQLQALRKPVEYSLKDNLIKS
ncbi:MAG TPA: glycosyltransferase family protein [Draconibacterium sp.]|nr:glycosyltransferase family protein [Draconibacterium sp.]